MKTKNIILIFLLITIVFSCRKPSETPIESTPKTPILPVLDSITRGFTVFKEGSWWIYESDSIMFNIGYNPPYFDFPDTVDSFKVFLDTIIYLQIDSINQSINNEIKRYLNINFSSPLFHKSYITKLFQDDSTYMKANYYTESGFYFNSSLDTVSLPSIYETPQEYGYFVENLDTMTVKGRTYYDIRHFIAVTSGSQKYWYHFYWAKNIGLIKYYKTTGVVPYLGISWMELVDYNVEQ